MRKKRNQSYKVWTFYINKDNPLLKATPDGIVSCKCCGKGLSEVKCPNSDKYRLLSGREKAVSNTYQVTIGEKNMIALKNSSFWYKQIQINLNVFDLIGVIL